MSGNGVRVDIERVRKCAERQAAQAIAEIAETCGLPHGAASSALADCLECIDSLTITWGDIRRAAEALTAPRFKMDD